MLAPSIPVTVVIPAYNASSFIAQAIHTVRAQTVAVDEIIVVDDASTDDTVAVAEHLGARVLSIAHEGPGAARNAGINAATSPWIATLDADDRWHPRKLELQFEAIERDPSIGLIFSDFDAVSYEDGRIHQRSVVGDDPSFERLTKRPVTASVSLLDFDEFLSILPARSIILPSSAMFLRTLALRVGGFLTTVTAEDTEFFLRLTAITTTAFAKLPLLAYGRHEAQITSTWKLDPVRLSLYDEVIANPERYHSTTLAGFRRQHAKLLYYFAAGAMRERRYATALACFAKALLTGSLTGELFSLLRVLTESTSVRGFAKRLNLNTKRTRGHRFFGDQPIVCGVLIPWRETADTH